MNQPSRCRLCGTVPTVAGARCYVWCDECARDGEDVSAAGRTPEQALENWEEQNAENADLAAGALEGYRDACRRGNTWRNSLQETLDDAHMYALRVEALDAGQPDPQLKGYP